MEERAKVVLAMEFLARHINDEEVFEKWLICGVADGDIPYDSMETEDVDEYYLEDGHFAELMEEFLRVMAAAKKSGGLYCDGVVSR